MALDDLCIHAYSLSRCTASFGPGFIGEKTLPKNYETMSGDLRALIDRDILRGSVTRSRRTGDRSLLPIHKKWLIWLMLTTASLTARFRIPRNLAAQHKKPRDAPTSLLVCLPSRWRLRHLLTWYCLIFKKNCGSRIPLGNKPVPPPSQEAISVTRVQNIVPRRIEGIKELSSRDIWVSWDVNYCHVRPHLAIH